MISESKISGKLSLCFCCTDQGGPDEVSLLAMLQCRGLMAGSLECYKAGDYF